MIEAKVLNKYLVECALQKVSVELFNNSDTPAEAEVEVKVGYKTVGKEKVELKPYEKRKISYSYRPGPTPGLGPMGAVIYVLINGETAHMAEVPVLPLKPEGMIAAVGAFLLSAALQGGLVELLSRFGQQTSQQLSQFIPYSIQMLTLFSYVHLFEYMTNLSECVKF